MHLAKNLSQTELLTYVSSIKENMGEWQVINLRIGAETKSETAPLSRKLLDLYETDDGFLFQAGERKIIMVVRLGAIKNFAYLKRDLQTRLQDELCQITAWQINASTLDQIQLDLISSDNAGIEQDASLFDARETREKNHIMIVDDDAFTRNVLAKMCATRAEVTEFSDGDNLLEHYMQHNPDILLLDIHMPNHNGLSLVDKIIEADFDAYIVVLSADSIRQNVLTALEKGAAGFLAKPPDKAKLTGYMNACLTFNAPRPGPAPSTPTPN